MAKTPEKKRRIEQPDRLDEKTPIKRIKKSEDTPASVNVNGSTKKVENVVSPVGEVKLSRKEKREQRDLANGVIPSPAVATAAAQKEKAKQKQANGTPGKKETPLKNETLLQQLLLQSQKNGTTPLKKEKLQQQANGTPRSEERKKEVTLGNTEKESRLEKKLRKEREASGFPAVSTVSTTSLVQTITQTDSAQTWTFSPRSAGRLLDHDPVFVRDEAGRSCLIAATDGEVQLLSLDTTLLIRAHAAPEGRKINCFTVRGQFVDVVYDNGVLVSWNYLTSTESFSRIAKAVVAITATEDFKTFYLRSIDGESSIFLKDKSLFQTTQRLSNLEVLAAGVYVVAWGPNVLVVGTPKGASTASDDAKFIWLEFPFTVPITCAATRLVNSQDNKTKKKKPELAVAIGNKEGQIHLYTTISSMFGSASSARLPNPQILHWHRHSLGAVKFSKDGNYIISGGRETVLVLWQLATGNKQYLPHLTAEIEGIVVSPDGTRYALQMADNSILVLSTSELKAVAHFPGLQIPVQTRQKNKELFRTSRKVAAALHPTRSRQLLLAVPSSVPHKESEITSRPFLQTFDLHYNRHLNRQALTRNNITDFNEGPEGQAILPPDVSALAISSDGKWLATVDEWSPPVTDLRHVAAATNPHNLPLDDLANLKEQQDNRREVHLKFWQWDEVQSLWILNTRADSPHARSIGASLDTGAGRVLRLISDPTSAGFVTIGEDSIVKIWRPKTHLRHGIAVKDENGSDEIEWSCKRTVHLPVLTEAQERADSPMNTHLGSEQKMTLRDACLAFSPDGSLLACAQVYLGEGSDPLVHFVSPESGAIVESKSRLTLPDADLVDLAFMERYFVAVSKSSIRVWNLVDDAYHWTVSLPPLQKEVDGPLLAVDNAENTFAVVTADAVPSKRGPVYIARVWNPKTSDRLFEAQLDTVPVAVLTEPNGRGGFTFVFADGSIRTLANSGSPVSREFLALTASAAKEMAEEKTGGGIEETNQALSALALVSRREEDVKMTTTTADVVDDEDERTVVRPEQLASIFDVGGGSTALPPVRDMFQAVVGLYARKPRAVVKA